MNAILRELSEVQRQLNTLPKDAVERKYALLMRQDELHTRAARLADQIDEGRSTQDLLARLAELRWQLAALERQRSGRPGTRAEQASRPMSDRSSASRIETRIIRIQSLLARRGIDIR